VLCKHGNQKLKSESTTTCDEQTANDDVENVEFHDIEVGEEESAA